MHFNVTSLLVGLTSLLTLSPSPRNSKSLSNTTNPPSFQHRNLATIQKIYSLNLYPTNLAFLDNQTVPPGFFDEHASGRITPFGNFTDFAESTEYFFGLSLTPEDPDNLAFTKVEVVEYQSSCAEVASSVAWLYLGVYNPGAANHGQVVSVLKQVRFALITSTLPITCITQTLRTADQHPLADSILVFHPDRLHPPLRRPPPLPPRLHLRLDLPLRPLLLASIPQRHNLPALRLHPRHLRILLQRRFPTGFPPPDPSSEARTTGTATKTTTTTTTPDPRPLCSV